jgi:triphosphoribosyl-dephospho-CoA synthase
MEGALAVERAGGVETESGRQELQRLDRRLINLGVSPGGSADILAATLFLDAVEQGLTQIQADESWPENSYGTN